MANKCFAWERQEDGTMGCSALIPEAGEEMRKAEKCGCTLCPFYKPNKTDRREDHEDVTYFYESV